MEDVAPEVAGVDPSTRWQVLPPALLERIDAYVEQLKREAPWSNATRADGTRALLGQAQDANDAKARKPAPR